MKSKSKRVKAERCEELRMELISQLSTKLKEEATVLTASLDDVIEHGKVCKIYTTYVRKLPCIAESYPPSALKNT